MSWIYSSSDRQYLYGINIVFLIWTDGNTRFPIGFRIWNKNDNKTKIDLAIELLLEAQRKYHIKPDFVLMDSFYPVAKLLKTIRLLNGIQVQSATGGFKYRYGNQAGKLSENIKVLIVKDKDNYS